MSIQGAERLGISQPEVKESGWKILSVELVDNKPQITPVIINPNNPDDKLSVFVVQTLIHARDMLSSLKLPVSEIKSHGRRRSKRELGDIREQRLHEISDVKRAIDALEGNSEFPIEFIRSNEGEIAGFKVHDGVINPGGGKK